MSSFGAFKGTHNGQGIYFAGGVYNLDGSGCYRTLREARAAIDESRALVERSEAAVRSAKAESGAYIVFRRKGDTVEVTVPGEPATVVSVRRARQIVFELESTHNTSVVWV